MRPLEGTRILTLESFGAAPYGTMLLADLGAEIIKIENPATGGDASRSVGPNLLGDKDSQYFQSFNLGKQSVALDLTHPADQKSFHALVATADAVVNNLRGDLPEKLGVDFASLRDINPAIVCLHISAYGRDNSRQAWPGYDYLAQAEAGLMSMTGEPDGPPCRIGLSMIDYMTGITGMVGLLGCLMSAKTTGRGCDVDTNLFDVATHQHCYLATWYLNSGSEPQRNPRSAHPSIVPVQSVRTKDGWIYVMCMKDKFWVALAQHIGRDDLVSDRRFSTQEARRNNRDQLTGELDSAMSLRSTEEWLSILTGVIPVAPIHSVREAFSSRFMEEAGMVTSVRHPLKPTLQVLASPLKIDGTRPPKSACEALGGGNERYLAGLTPRPQELA
ncbi:crotonobetainyl-CoA:carnitine CoA-transferase CaiB-like acyl-CoA transferase [Rhodoligotrophos appendicifer]|uniref:CaiB/BaiF CoA transferase family protein n=1 Tax=Rhodoligotrophos appendicifer TaxID=987056 RepID=UPI0011871206|nr:CoA transferase [Rhodoligotrophos appendicifer]